MDEIKKKNLFAKILFVLNLRKKSHCFVNKFSLLRHTRKIIRSKNTSIFIKWCGSWRANNKNKLPAVVGSSKSYSSPAEPSSFSPFSRTVLISNASNRSLPSKSTLASKHWSKKVTKMVWCLLKTSAMLHGFCLDSDSFFKILNWNFYLKLLR